MVIKSKALLRAFHQHQNNPGKIVPHVVKLAEIENASSISCFFTDCVKTGFPTIELSLSSIHELLKKNRKDIVKELYELSDENDPLYGIYCIGQSLSELDDFYVSAGAEKLRKGIFYILKTLKKNRREKFEALGFLVQNAFLLESVEWPHPNMLPEPEMEIVCDNFFDSSPYTACVACDTAYFDFYFDSFANSLRNQCGEVNIFLLLVNPDSITIDRASKHQGIAVAKSIYDGRWLSEFSTAVRFIFADKIIKMSGTSTIFFDIDSSFPNGANDVLNTLAKCDLALCQTKEMTPMLKISAALLAARASNDTFAFFQSVKNNILADFTQNGPIWGIDQIALYKAACELNSARILFSDINSLIDTPKPLPDLFTRKKDEVIPLEKRRAIRSTSFYKYAGITNDHRLLFETL